MSLSPAQYQTLKTDLAANTNTVLINGVATAINAVIHGPDTASAVKDWYNLLSSPAFIVWRTDVSQDDVNNSVDWGEVVTKLTTVTLLAFEILKNQSKINASLASIRNAFTQIFPVATLPNSNAALTTVAQRTAHNIEKLFATGTGTTVSPGVMGFEGSIVYQDIQIAWAS